MFEVSQVESLGYMVFVRSDSTLPEKLEVVVTISLPSSMEPPGHYLGMLNFYIGSISEIVVVKRELSKCSAMRHQTHFRL